VGLAEKCHSLTALDPVPLAPNAFARGNGYSYQFSLFGGIKRHNA
jgi:hypothetical protein